MKSYRLFLTIFIGLGFSSFLLSQNKDQLFYDAVRSEASGDIASAISSYEKALKLGYSSKLYGNLGNLYFKIKKYGHSILCYRKALILSPSNREISANLDFAREIAGVKSVGLRSVDILGMNIENFWLISVILVFWTGAFVISFFYFLRWEWRRISWYLLVWLISLTSSFWFYVDSVKDSQNLAREVIVLKSFSENNDTSEIPLRRYAGKNSSANAMAIIGESLFLQTDENGHPKKHMNLSGENWYLVVSADQGKKGWIRTEEVGLILEDHKPMEQIQTN